MTKENSTKPAFVSEGSGRGDGFLVATRVGIVRSPAMSCCFPPLKQPQARWIEERAHREITAAISSENWGLSDTDTNCVVKQCAVFTHIVSSGWIYFSTHFNSTNIQPKNRRNTVSQSMSNDWLQHMCAALSVTLTFCNLLTRGHDYEASLTLVFGHHTCPQRAIRVWSPPSLWPLLERKWKEGKASLIYIFLIFKITLPLTKVSLFKTRQIFCEQCLNVQTWALDKISFILGSTYQIILYSKPPDWLLKAAHI